MRQFAVLAVAAATFAFVAPSTAHAQVVSTSYHSGYAPYSYGGTGVYGNNFGVVQSGYGISNYGFVPSYPAGGYRTYSYPVYNQGFNNYGSYNRGFYNGGYVNRRYTQRGFGGRRR